MRLTSPGLVAAVFCVLSCLPTLAQEQKLTPPEKDLVNQPNDPTEPHPLSDYVPCSFVVKDRDKFHGVFGKKGNTAIALARNLVDSSNMTPEQKTFFHSQVNALSSRYGVTLNNIVPLLEQQINQGTKGFDATKLPADVTSSFLFALDSSAKEIKSIPAPNDIGCSESVLTYAETRDIFGKRMANTYIAVQVTVRNLNQDNEFLLHDIQVAVNTDLFFNTRDRRLARGVAEIGQTMNPRNQTMRYLEGAAGALGAAAVPLGNVAFSDAAHGFTTFVPVVKGVFPDFSIAQLGRLDDLGFTSGSLTYVIPKSGSHALVAFIPELVFRTALVQQTTGAARRKNSSTGHGDSSTQPPPDATAPSAPPEASSKYKKFKDYTTDDLKAFQNSLEILVAGAHVKEVSTVKPDATSLTCDPPKGTGASDTETCHLTGKNLQAVKSVKLVLKSDSTEGSAISTKFDVNKTDTTKADVEFHAQDFATLKKGKGYSIVLTTQDDSTINTSATFTPEESPEATSMSCDKPVATTVSCHLVGKNLKAATQLKLTPSSGTAISSTKFEPDKTDDTKATATFGETEFAGLKPDQKYSVVLVVGGKDLKTTYEFSPAAPAAGAPDATTLTCIAPKNKTASVPCQLSGKNLKAVKQLKLLPKSGKAVLSSKFEPNASDHTKATVTFSGTDFSALSKGEPYGLTLVPETGQEVKTSATYTPR